MYWDSYILQQISVSTGLSVAELLEEIERREVYLRDMIKSGMKDQRKIAEKILAYQTKKRNERKQEKLTLGAKPDTFKDLKNQVLKQENKKIEKIPLVQEIIQKEVTKDDNIQEIVKENEPLIASNIESMDVATEDPQTKENTLDSINNDLDAATKMLWELARETTNFKQEKKPEPVEEVIEEVEEIQS
jgi:hypothetical protein